MATSPGAAIHFQKATVTDPNSAKAFLYLGIALDTSYVPGAHSETNDKLGSFMEAAFRKAQELSPDSKVNLMALGMCLYEIGHTEQNADETRKLNEARQIMKRVAAINPKFEIRNLQPGRSMDAMSAYRPFYEVITKGGDRRNLRERVKPIVEDAITSLNHALELEPVDSDAMRYLTICWNMKAELADDPAERKSAAAKNKAMLDRAVSTEKARAAGRAGAAIPEPAWGFDIEPVSFSQRVPPLPPPPPPGKSQ